MGQEWPNFLRDFWAAYYAVSPEEFDRLWAILPARYVNGRPYLAELYSQRDRWAYAWVGNMFTAGVRTTGRAESENSVNKGLGGPKVSLFQAYTALNERTKTQDSSRRQHDTQLESLFHDILAMLRDVVGPFALNKCYDQMAKSLFYEASLLQLPEGTRTWGMFNTFENDTAYMSTQWMLRQMQDRGLVPTYLVRVTHKTAGTIHIIAIFPDGRYVCDCCMGTNLGIVCSHFFLAWTKMDGLPFHVSLIRARSDSGEFQVQ
ncbi:hypothetical protein FB451DRAFT_1054258 [Mycena latifolia]|nr:hypothetical protein FB451DRAFT_1054258 [Mycena latifolia]